MFKQDVKEFMKSKTNWLGVGMIAGGVIGLTSADPTDVQLKMDSAKSIAAGLALIFVRDGIAGVKKNANPD